MRNYAALFLLVAISLPARAGRVPTSIPARQTGEATKTAKFVKKKPTTASSEDGIVDLRAKEQSKRDEKVADSASSSRTWGWVNTALGASVAAGGAYYMFKTEEKCEEFLGEELCTTENPNMLTGSFIFLAGGGLLTYGIMQLITASMEEDIHEGLKSRNEPSTQYLFGYTGQSTSVGVLYTF